MMTHGDDSFLFYYKVKGTKSGKRHDQTFIIEKRKDRCAVEYFKLIVLGNVIFL